MNLNYTTLPLLVGDNVKTVGVKFYNNKLGQYDHLGDKTYTYKTTLNLEINDLCVVVVGKVPKVVVVVELGPPADNDGYQYKWIVAKVDFTAYFANLAMEAELTARVRKLEQEHQRRQILDVLDPKNEIKVLSFQK